MILAPGLPEVGGHPRILIKPTFPVFGIHRAAYNLSVAIPGPGRHIFSFLVRTWWVFVSCRT